MGHGDSRRALTGEELERRGLSKTFLPHVMMFYANDVDAVAHVPFYKPSSSV